MYMGVIPDYLDAEGIKKSAPHVYGGDPCLRFPVSGQR